MTEYSIRFSDRSSDVCSSDLPQNILSCSPSEAAAIAADIGQHVIVLGVVASARDIRAEFGNFLDHDDDIISALAKEGRIAMFRTSLEDAETIYFDLQRDRKSTRLNSSH